MAVCPAWAWPASSSTMLSENLKAEIISFAQSQFPREACGLILDNNKFFPCANIAERNIDFIMSPDDYAKADEQGEITSIVHSHCNQGPEPSQADLVSCESSLLPWHIVSLPNLTWGYCAPKGYIAPLIGRQFSHGVLDCYSLVRDFYKLEMGIILPFFERSEKWWERGQNLYMENFEIAGFEQVKDGTLCRGDGLIMQVMSNVPNHAAIYLGEGIVLHHLMNRLSGRDVYGGYWQKHTRLVVRYKGL